jgi:hypothetical protein
MLTSPVLRVLQAPPSVVIMGITAPGLPAPGGPTLSTSIHSDVDFSNQGSAQLLGQPIPTGGTIFVQNDNLPTNSPDFGFRIDITSLTGYVSTRTN